MKEATIVKAAIVQLVHYPSEDAMYRINARKVCRGIDIRYLAIERYEDGTVSALLEFSYNDKETFNRAELMELLRNG